MYCHTCKNAEADTDDSNLYLEPKMQNGGIEWYVLGSSSDVSFS